jgi:hypothetical protein
MNWHVLIIHGKRMLPKAGCRGMKSPRNGHRSSSAGTLPP